MSLYFFIDETGDHSLDSIDETYPLLLICGAIFRQNEYETLQNEFDAIKTHFWDRTDVIFHSYKIRKAKGDFNILDNRELLTEFYTKMNHAVTVTNYHIVSCYIDKQKVTFPLRLKAPDAYHLAMGFVLERLVFYLDKYHPQRTKIYIVLESRDAAQDKKLNYYCKDIIRNGTAFLRPHRFTRWVFEILFRKKSQNINGLQLADLLAYPIAQKVFKPDTPNPAYDIIEPKFYCGQNCNYGLKLYP